MSLSYLFVGSLITHHTNSLHGKQNRKCLGNLIVKTCFANFLNIYVISQLEGFDLGTGYRPQYTNGKAWARERVTADKMRGYRKQFS